MKAIAFCLFMLVLGANTQTFDWTGTWFNGGGTDFMCVPTGLITIKQDASGKATIEGRWDEYSEFCKTLREKDPKLKVEGVAQGNELPFELDTGVVKTKCTLTKKDNEYGIRCVLPGKSYSVDLYQKSSANSIPDWEGVYSFTPVAGTSEKCCFPESMDITTPREAVYVTEIKWSVSEGCKEAKVDGQTWKEIHTTFSNIAKYPLELMQTRRVNDQEEYKAYAYKNEDGSLDYKRFNNPGIIECKATMKVEKKKSWTMIIIIAAVAGVLIIGAIVGFVVYSKKKKQAEPSPGNEYGQMVSA